MPYGIARLPSPGYLLIAGRDFGQEWEIAETENGPIDTLEDYLAASVVAKPVTGGDEIEWTLAGGKVSITDGVIALALDEADTLALKDSPGAWSALLSLGLEAGKADEAVLAFYLDVEVAPDA